MPPGELVTSPCPVPSLVTVMVSEPPSPVTVGVGEAAVSAGGGGWGAGTGWFGPPAAGGGPTAVPPVAGSTTKASVAVAATGSVPRSQTTGPAPVQVPWPAVDVTGGAPAGSVCVSFVSVEALGALLLA